MKPIPRQYVDIACVAFLAYAAYMLWRSDQRAVEAARQTEAMSDAVILAASRTEP